MAERSEFSFCRLGPADLPALLAMERECFSHPWSEEQSLLGLGRGLFHVFGFKRGDALAAYLSFIRAADEMEVLNLAVQPHLRRMGLGRRLLGLALQIGAGMGIHRVFLDVRRSNAAALALYTSFGFARTGVRKGYYPDNMEDAVTMRLDMPPVPGPGRGKHANKEPLMIRSLDDLDLKGKRCLVRVDFNVPLKNGQITDDNRIRASLPSIEKALAKGAALVLCSHLGKPKGKRVPELSLAPVAVRLSELLGREVKMAPDCIGPEVEKMAKAMKPGEVLLLENLRFHPEEEKGGEDFARGLASLADAYVNDAFGTAHRAHASMVGVARHMRQCAAGELMIKEYEYLNETLKSPERPFAAITAGAKVSSKLGILRNLLGKVDILVIGGAMANTFLLAQGRQVGTSLVEPDLVPEAKGILADAEKKGVEIVLPLDLVLGEGPDGKAEKTVGLDQVDPGLMILDVGPKTVERLRQVLAKARTVVWNGPVGAFENPEFAKGSLALADILATIVKEKAAVVIVGGGDTGALLAQSGKAGEVTFISTGGGSFLELLEGKEMPAFKALEECGK